MEKMNQAFEKVKMLVRMEVEDEEQGAATVESSSFTFMDDFNRDCTLSTKQRFYGFAICFSAGLACVLLSMLVFFNPSQVWNYFHIWQFAFTWEILSWSRFYCSTAFLIGPKRQVSMMLDPVRIYATALYLASIIIALFCALYVHNKLLTLLAIILEFGALIWYSLSYIPFARAMVSKTMLACFDTEF
ncbi:hypothetical protein OIU85_027972 [Salix viminalis]|uniref:Vesicle transport protein n=1 Tax=Salix viminalis TaxID=40686 RepID=A0A9Q0TBF9_SALVM|nr:hypothetical protein OIU85_027972 [Salix viminalis]